MSKIGLAKKVCDRFDLWVDTGCAGLGGYIFENKIYERGLTEDIISRVGKSDLAIDIGANVGYFTCLFASLVGEYGEVIAFEPNSQNYELLRKNISINGFSNVTCINSAVGSISDQKELFLSRNNTGAHSLRKELVPNLNELESEEVNIISLSTFIGKRPVSFIKIDVQGYEIEVLKGYDPENTKAIWCELWKETGDCDKIKDYLSRMFPNIRICYDGILAWR